MSDRDQPRADVREPAETSGETASAPTPFPRTSPDAPLESFLPDWRERLSRNLSRRSVGRWEPLTRTHGAEG
jgi:hypothetical protein